MRDSDFLSVQFPPWEYHPLVRYYTIAAKKCKDKFMPAGSVLSTTIECDIRMNQVQLHKQAFRHVQEKKFLKSFAIKIFEHTPTNDGFLSDYIEALSRCMSKHPLTFQSAVLLWPSVQKNFVQTLFQRDT